MENFNFLAQQIGEWINSIDENTIDEFHALIVEYSKTKKKDATYFLMLMTGEALNYSDNPELFADKMKKYREMYKPLCDVDHVERVFNDVREILKK
jgi:hypothetical protein